MVSALGKNWLILGVYRTPASTSFAITKQTLQFYIDAVAALILTKLPCNYRSVGLVIKKTRYPCRRSLV